MTTIKELVPLAYLLIWAILYVFYQFKLTDSARSSRLFVDYIQKQSWFVFLSWGLLTYFIGLRI